MNSRALDGDDAKRLAVRIATKEGNEVYLTCEGDTLTQHINSLFDELEGMSPEASLGQEASSNKSSTIETTRTVLASVWSIRLL